MPIYLQVQQGPRQILQEMDHQMQEAAATSKFLLL